MKRAETVNFETCRNC